MFSPDEFACAQLHFTGSGRFNSEMRMHALTNGFTLNEKGLWRGKAASKGEQIQVKTEHDVFNAIGYPWREPHEREIGK